MMTQARKVTDIDFLKECINFCLPDALADLVVDREALYHQGEDPMRTQLFLVFMEVTKDVSDRFRMYSKDGEYHHVGPVFYEDDDIQVRRHVMLLNASHLVNMARVLLCTKSGPEVLEAMQGVVAAISQCDVTLSAYLVPDCYYRGGICPVLIEPCGLSIQYLRELISTVPEAFYRDSRNKQAVKEKSLLIN